MKPERVIKPPFLGRWIDLHAIVSIGDAFFDDGGCGIDSEAEVGFVMYCDASESKTNDKTKIVYRRGIRPTEKGTFYDPNRKYDSSGFLLTDGSVKSMHWDNRIPQFHLETKDFPNLIALKNMQEAIDSFVKIWKEYKESLTVHKPATDVLHLIGKFFVDDKGVYRYINPHGYEHCNHEGQKLIPISTSWGNKSFVCSFCGQIAKKELTSTSL